MRRGASPEPRGEPRQFEGVVGDGSAGTSYHGFNTRSLKGYRSRGGMGRSVGSGDIELLFEGGKLFGVVDEFESLTEMIGAESNFDTTLLGRK